MNTNVDSDDESEDLNERIATKMFEEFGNMSAGAALY